MASIIDYKYFIGERLIGGIESVNVQQVVAQYITKYEAEFYKEVMGYELATLFWNGINQNTVDQKWADIVNGKEYSHGGHQTSWIGLRQTDAKTSVVADYVYYFYLRDNYTKSARMGVVKPQSENATTFNPNARMVAAWNRVSEQVTQLRRFLRYYDVDGERVYPEYSCNNWRWGNDFAPINVFGI